MSNKPGYHLYSSIIIPHTSLPAQPPSTFPSLLPLQRLGVAPPPSPAHSSASATTNLVATTVVGLDISIPIISIAHFNPGYSYDIRVSSVISLISFEICVVVINSFSGIIFHPFFQVGIICFFFNIGFNIPVLFSQA